MNRIGFVLIATIAALACAVAPAFAAPGDVDRSFGDRGEVLVPLVPGGEDRGQMVVGPGGEVVEATSTRSCGSGACTLTLHLRRYDADGDADTAFGGDGVVTVESTAPILPLGGPPGAQIAVDPDGSVVVATVGDELGLRLVRFRTDGTPDTRFAFSEADADRLGPLVSIDDLQVLADGRVVVAGTRPGNDLIVPVISRILANGGLDESFGDRGAAVLDFAIGRAPISIAPSATGQLWVALTPACCSYGEGLPALLARLSDGGALDKRFAGQGARTVDAGRAIRLSKVVALKHGAVVFGSARPASGPRRAFVVRYGESGGLATKFGRRGFVYPGAGEPVFEVHGAVDRAGRIVIAIGNLVFRYRSRGVLDRTFRGGTGVRLPMEATQVAVQRGGRILALGPLGECVRVCARQTVIVALRGGGSKASCQGRRATVVGTRRGDRLVGTRRRDVIQGLGGDDRIFGFAGNDVICGGPGADEISGGKGRDRISGGKGRDSVSQR